MKNFIVLFMFCLVMCTSCDKDWLEPKPLSINTPENIYVDEEGMEAVLLVMRRYLRDDFVGKWPSNIAFENMSSDLGIAGESKFGLVQNFDIQMTPTGVGNKNNIGTWDDAWRGIREANIAISRIDAPEWKNEENKNAVLGEAYFHRAYWYYKLINQFGEVPFLSKEFTQPKTDFYTNSRESILKQLQEDLEFSVTSVPENVLPGKVNRAACYHLLAKIYLSNSLFDKAIEATSAVIDGGKYALMEDRFGVVADDPRFNVIWDLHQKENKSLPENKEGILVVQDEFGVAGASSALGAYTMFQFTPWWSHSLWLKDPDGKRGCVDMQFNPQVLAFGRGVGQSRPSKYFSYDIWEDSGDDLRHDQDTNWMPTSKILYNNPESAFYGQPVDFSYSIPIDSLRAFFPWPQYKLYVEDKLRPAQPRGGNSDWYVFRLAGTHLLRAEAYLWKGDLASAAEDVNKVRARSHAPLIDVGDMSIDVILDERARELSFESPRFTELTRISYIMAKNGFDGYSLANIHENNFWYDRVVSKNNFYNKGVIWETNEYKLSPYHIFWPIPQNSIDSNTGGKMNQNPGYSGADDNIPPLSEISEDQ